MPRSVAHGRIFIVFFFVPEDDDEEPEYQDESEEEEEDDDLVRADCLLVGGILIKTGGLHLCFQLLASG